MSIISTGMNLSRASCATSSLHLAWRWTLSLTSSTTATGWSTGANSSPLWDPIGRTGVRSPTPRGLRMRSQDKWPSAHADRNSKSSKWAKENIEWVILSTSLLMVAISCTQCVQSFKQGTFFTTIKTYLGKLLHLSLSYDFSVLLCYSK